MGLIMVAFVSFVGYAFLWLCINHPIVMIAVAFWGFVVIITVASLMKRGK